MTLDITETFPESVENSIFKKSEHEKIMEELAEIKRRLKDLQTYPPPYIPYPCVPYSTYPQPWNPPCVPYYYCNNQWTYNVDPVYVECN